MVFATFNSLREGMSLLKLGLGCAGLNLLTAALATMGAELGLWAAGESGSSIGLATGLAVGLLGHAAGSRRIADKEARL